MERTKVLFIFSGYSRKDNLENIYHKKVSDSMLRGSNHLDTDLRVNLLDIYQDSAYAAFLNKYFGQKILYFLYHKKILQNKYVIVSAPEVYFFFLKLVHIFRKKTKSIYIALTINTLLQKYKHNAIKIFILKGILNSFDKIICISNDQYNNLLEMGLEKNKLVYTPYGIDCEFYKNSNTENINDYILSVGRDAGRDYRTLLLAAKEIKHKILIVASPKNIPTDIEIPDNVEILYDLTESELRELYKRSMIMLVPSLPDGADVGSDCSGQTVIIEAMSDKKLVIATEKSWINDYFEIEKDIIIVKNQDPKDLAEKINFALARTAAVKEIEENAYAKVNEKYSSKIFGHNLSKIVKDIQ